MEQLWNSGLHWNIMNHEWSAAAGACKVIMNKWWIPRVVESKSGPGQNQQERNCAKYTTLHSNVSGEQFKTKNASHIKKN